MSYQSDFDTWKERIEAMPQNQVKLPNMPVDDFAAKCEKLAIGSAKDKEELAHAGMDVTIIDELTPLAGALRFSQANWMSEYRKQEDAQKEWRIQSPEAYKLRKDLLHHFSFAYRNVPDVIKKVARVREGSGHADMIQDLLEIAVLGEKNPKPLNQVNFDMTKLQRGRTVSHNMSELLAIANGSDNESGVTKELRDKAYTMLFERESTIREYGRYVFWEDEDRKQKYMKD